jgi:hypothetical protein
LISAAFPSFKPERVLMQRDIYFTYQEMPLLYRKASGADFRELILICVSAFRMTISIGYLLALQEEQT